MTTTDKPLDFGFTHLVTTAFDVLKQAGDVAEAALVKLNAGTYDAAAWSKSVSDLININLTSYVGCVEKVLGGIPDMGSVLSSKVQVTVDAEFERTISKPFVMTSLVAPKVTIPETDISFDRTVLPPGATQFHVKVSDPKYNGAGYHITFNLVRTGPNAATNPKTVTITKLVGL